MVAEHQKLTLREIQLEALDWIIEEEKKQDKQLFAKDIVFLEQIRKKLASSTVPLEAPELGYSLIFRLGGMKVNDTCLSDFQLDTVVPLSIPFAAWCTFQTTN